MKNILNLHGYEVLNVKETSEDYCVQVRTKEQPVSKCLHCENLNSVRRFGVSSVLFMDLPMHAKRVGILVERQRFHCKSCNKTFFEPLPHVDDKRMCTERVIQYIAKESLKRTFTSIADEIGVNEATIRNIFSDWLEKVNLLSQKEVPRWLGIDEIFLIKPRCVLTNIQKRTVFDLLINRDKKTLTDYLLKLSDKDQIELVAIDMWRPYKEAVTVCLPQAKIVVDKFHVLKIANESLETFRTQFRKKLSSKERKILKGDRGILLKRYRDLDSAERLQIDSWFNQFSDLKIAYELKESFFAIYDNAGSCEEAKQYYQIWLGKTSPDFVEVFSPLITATTNWNTEIFNYFEFRITNAYTESLNSLIRVIDRTGRGYSFEVLRAKLLLTQGEKSTKRSTYERSAFRSK